MAYYPGYTFPGQPYADMQQRLGTMQWQNAQSGMPAMQYVSGRVVSNIEEAKAAQIPLDGSVSYFPCPSENRVFAKSIGMNGAAVFTVYEASLAPQPPAYAEADAVSALQRKVEQLEKAVRRLSNAKSATDTSSATE